MKAGINWRVKRRGKQEGEGNEKGGDREEMGGDREKGGHIGEMGESGSV